MEATNADMRVRARAMRGDLDEPVEDLSRYRVKHLPMTCSNGHLIRFIPRGFNKVRFIDGKRMVYEGDELDCTGCKKRFKISDKGGSYSCLEQCDFDLCFRCTRCEHNHELQDCFGNPY